MSETTPTPESNPNPPAPAGRRRLREHDDYWYFRFIAIAAFSLVGGIMVFIFLVVPDRDPEDGVPREVQYLFTNVYMNQGNMKNELNRYNPAVTEVGVEQEQCLKFKCLLTLTPDAQDYEFRLTKGTRTWAIHSRSPVPKEVTK